MRTKFPVHPPHPERNCWGCNQYCAANALACGNGADRTPHPVELFGDNWMEWGPGVTPGLSDTQPRLPPEKQTHP